MTLDARMESAFFVSQMSIYFLLFIRNIVEDV